MTIVIKERTGGHYEIVKIPYGTGYVWIQGEEKIDERLREEVLYPWHVDYEQWAKEERAHPELQEWLELDSLDKD